MAKKTVATLQTSSKRLTKAIKMVKSDKSGAYYFVESTMLPEKVNEWLAQKITTILTNYKSHDSWLFLFLTFTKKKNGDFQAVFFKRKIR